MSKCDSGQPISVVLIRLDISYVLVASLQLDKRRAILGVASKEKVNYYKLQKPSIFLAQYAGRSPTAE